MKRDAGRSKNIAGSAVFAGNPSDHGASRSGRKDRRQPACHEADGHDDRPPDRNHTSGTEGHRHENATSGGAGKLG
jgi:hypothetical protein